MLKYIFLFWLLIWKSKSFKNKVFDAWWREMRMNTTNRTRQKSNSNFPSQNTPTPACQLSIRYMPIFLVWWAFVCFVVLLFVLVPRCLKKCLYKEKLLLLCFNALFCFGKTFCYPLFEVEVSTSLKENTAAWLPDVWKHFAKSLQQEQEFLRYALTDSTVYIVQCSLELAISIDSFKRLCFSSEIGKPGP